MSSIHIYKHTAPMYIVRTCAIALLSKAGACARERVLTYIASLEKRI